MIKGDSVISDGFENFAGGQVIGCTSSTNVGGKAGNSAAMLVVSKNFSITPKVIKPQSKVKP